MELATRLVVEVLHGHRHANTLAPVLLHPEHAALLATHDRAATTRHSLHLSAPSSHQVEFCLTCLRGTRAFAIAGRASRTPRGWLITTLQTIGSRA